MADLSLKDAQSELDGLSSAPAATPGGMSLQDAQNELQSLPKSSVSSPVGEVGKGLAGVGKLLDYPAGNMRALIAEGVQGLTGKQMIKPGEEADSFNPFTPRQFPHSDQLLDRAGVPKGAKLSDILPGYGQPGQSPWYQPEKGGMLDPTVRGAGGTALDMATDPLMWASLGGKKAAQAVLDESGRASEGNLPAVQGAAQKAVSAQPSERTLGQILLNPVGEGAKDAGTALYRKGATPIIQAARKSGKGDLTDFYMNTIGMKGSPQTMADQLNAAKGDFGQQMGSILRQAGNKGATVPFDQALKPYINKIQQLVQDGHLTMDEAKAAATKALAPQMEYIAKNGNDVPTAIVHSWRQYLDNNKIPQNVWGEGAIANKKLGNQLTMALRGGYNDSVDKSITGALGDSAGSDFREANKNWGNVGSPKIWKTAQSTADTAEKRPFFSPWDAAYVAGGGMAGEEMGGHTLDGALAGMVARKGIQAAQSPWALTHAGSALNKFGNTPVLSPMVSEWARNKFSRTTNPEE